MTIIIITKDEIILFYPWKVGLHLIFQVNSWLFWEINLNEVNVFRRYLTRKHWFDRFGKSFRCMILIFTKYGILTVIRCRVVFEFVFILYIIQYFWELNYAYVLHLVLRVAKKQLVFVLRNAAPAYGHELVTARIHVLKNRDQLLFF